MRGRILIGFLCAVVLLFLMAPLAVVAATSFNGGAVMFFPPRDLSLKWYHEIFAYPEFIDSLYTSLLLACMVTVVSCIVSVMVALAFVRYRYRGIQVLEALVLSPLILPAVILGLALLISSAAVGLRASFEVLVLAHCVIATPFATRAIVASLSGLDPRLEEAARNLGASPFQAFRRITLPLLRPGIAAGAIFAFIASFDELVVTLFIADPASTTLPVRIYTYVQFSNDPMIAAISTALIVISFIALVALDRLIGLRRLV